MLSGMSGLDIWGLVESNCRHWDIFADIWNGGACITLNAARPVNLREALGRQKVPFRPICFSQLRGRDRSCLSRLTEDTVDDFE